MKGMHGTGVAATLVGSQPPSKIGEEKEMGRVVETLLVLSMTALHLSVVPGIIGADELVAYSHLSGRCLEEGF